MSLPQTVEHRSRLIAGLAAALEQSPLSALTTTDIAREASVSKRTFYEYFANKEECFLALYRQNSARILAVLQAATATLAGTWEERIVSGTHAYLAEMQSQTRLMQRLYIDILGLGAEGMRVRREITQQFAEVLIAIFNEERQRLPMLPPIDPQMVLGVIAGLNELILYQIEDGKAERLLELVTPTRLLITGIVHGLLLQGAAG